MVKRAHKGAYRVLTIACRVITRTRHSEGEHNTLSACNRGKIERTSLRFLVNFLILGRILSSINLLPNPEGRFM